MHTTRLGMLILGAVEELIGKIKFKILGQDGLVFIGAIVETNIRLTTE